MYGIHYSDACFDIMYGNRFEDTESPFREFGQQSHTEPDYAWCYTKGSCWGSSKTFAITTNHDIPNPSACAGLHWMFLAPAEQPNQGRVVQPGELRPGGARGAGGGPGGLEGLVGDGGEGDEEGHVASTGKQRIRKLVALEERDGARGQGARHAGHVLRAEDGTQLDR